MRLLPSLSVAFLAAPLLAHDVFPSSITLRPGGEDYIFVADQGTCPADIKVTSSNPAAVQVFAINMFNGLEIPGNGSVATAADRVTQVFVVRAASNITSPVALTMDVCWVGSDFPSPPCNENNCNPSLPHPVAVNVDPNAETSGARLACGMARDPVNTSNGELVQVEAADLELASPMALRFIRYYASRLAIDGEATSTLGPNWLHNFAWQLRSTGNNVEVVNDVGRVIRFERGYFDTAWTLAVVQDIPYQLTGNPGTFQLADPLDGRIYSFDAQGRLTQIDDGRGNTHTLSYGGGNLSSVSDGLGHTLTFVHAAGRMSSVSDGTRTVQFTYDGSNRLASARNPELETTNYAYDAAQPASALLTAITQPLGNVPYTQTYDSQKRVATQTDAFTNQWSFAYGANGVTTVTDPLGGTQVHDHNADGELTSWQDEGGTDATLQNDAKGRRTSVTDRLGRTTSWTIHAASGKLAQVTEADGTRTTYGYTARTSGPFTFHDLTSVAHTDGRTESFGHDASGNVSTWTDRAGESWSYTYDSHGQRLTETNPEGGVTTQSYNADGTLASSQDDSGNVTTFGYDALDRLTTVTHPDTTTRTLVYDAADRVLSVTDEESESTGFTYDDNGNLVSLLDPAGQSWSLCFDDMDRACGNSDPLGNGTSSTFDELGRVSSVTDGSGNTTQVSYDARGRIDEVTDELGHTWPASHDLEGRPSSVSDPLGNSNAIATNAMGRITRVTTPLGNATNYAYDAKGRVTSTTDAGGKQTRVTYDARGRVSAVALPNGASSTFTRDDNGEVSSFTPPGAGTWQYAHDPQGRLTSSTDPLGRTTSYGYDERSRVDSKTLPGGLGTATYQYDDVGRLALRSYSDGTSISYTYDAAGRLTATDNVAFGYDAAGRMNASNGTTMTHDGAGRIASVTFGPGMTVTYGYDARGLCTSMTDWLGGVSTFEYDDAGRRTRITRPNSTETLYQYDDDGNLTSIVELDTDPVLAAPSASGFIERSRIDLLYNARGFKSSATRATPLAAKPALDTLDFDYDAAGQIQGWTYDEAGNALSDHMHFWSNVDLADRVLIFREDGVDHSLEYDGLDRVRSLAFGGLTYDFRWNYGYPEPSIDEMDWGTGSTLFVHTPDGAVFCEFDVLLGTFQYVHFDENGSTIYRSGPDGEVTARYAYGEVGDLLQRDDTGYHPLLYRARDNGLSLGTGRFTWLKGRYPFDSCTRRLLIAGAVSSFFTTPYDFKLAEFRRKYGPVRPTGEILDTGWLPQTPELDLERYSVKADWSLKAGYNAWPHDDWPNPASSPAPDTSGGKTSYGLDLGIDFEMSLTERFGLLGYAPSPEPRNHSQVLLKFKAARMLASSLRPRSFSSWYRERALRVAAISTWQTLALLDSTGITATLAFQRGPSALRGALQEPELALTALGAPVPGLFDLPMLGNLFSPKRATDMRPALLLLLTQRIVRDQVQE